MASEHNEIEFYGPSVERQLVYVLQPSIVIKVILSLGEDPGIYSFGTRSTILVALCMEAIPIHIILLIHVDFTVKTLGDTSQLI